MKIQLARFSITFSLFLFCLSGCSANFGTISNDPRETATPIQSMVHGGQQSIRESRIHRYTANASAYNSTAHSLLTDTAVNENHYVLANAADNFGINGNFACIPNTQVYLYSAAIEIWHRQMAQVHGATTRLSAIWIASKLKRRILGLAADFLLCFSSLILALFAFALVRSGRVIAQQRLRLDTTPFDDYEFDFKDSKLSRHSLRHRIPSLINILMGYIGLLPTGSARDLGADARTAQSYDLSPSVLNPWGLRHRVNIAYRSERSQDLEYVAPRTLRGDLSIVLRAIPALLFGNMEAPPPSGQVRLMGVTIDNLTMAESCQRIIGMAQATTSGHVAFVNADCLNIAYQNHHYLSSLNQADLVLADGIGVRIAGMVLNQKIHENVNGTDMLPQLAAAMQERGLGLYLLGGIPGVAKASGYALQATFPNLRICGAYHGYFEPEDEMSVLDAIRSSEANVVLVAFGVPLQDDWIAKHRAELGSVVLLGVGGLFDFCSGRIPRAPGWMRALGMEWFFRFLQEPRRLWRRYLVGNFLFLWRVVLERLRGRFVASDKDSFW